MQAYFIIWNLNFEYSVVFLKSEITAFLIVFINPQNVPSNWHTALLSSAVHNSHLSFVTIHELSKARANSYRPYFLSRVWHSSWWRWGQWPPKHFQVSVVINVIHGHDDVAHLQSRSWSPRISLERRKTSLWQERRTLNFDKLEKPSLCISSLFQHEYMRQCGLYISECKQLSVFNSGFLIMDNKLKSLWILPPTISTTTRIMKADAEVFSSCYCWSWNFNGVQYVYWFSQHFKEIGTPTIADGDVFYGPKYLDVFV